MSAMPAPSSQYSSYPLPDAQGQGHAQAGPTNMQALNLPPIRSGDGGPQVQQPPPPPPPQQQPQPGQVPPQSMQYYLAPGQPYPTQPGDPNAHMRFGSIPIPPADSRIMSGGRHKKEIKRRTKTGCLTCRKRRIKVRRVFQMYFAHRTSHLQHRQSFEHNHEKSGSCLRLIFTELLSWLRSVSSDRVKRDCYWATLHLSVFWSFVQPNAMKDPFNTQYQSLW